MSATPLHIDASTFSSRLRALLRGRGGPRPWPRRMLDRWVLLHAVGRRLQAGEELSERDANARIQNWLLGPGASLRVDFVTIRRALIDEGVWDREHGGTRYRRSERHARRVRFDLDLPDEDEVLLAAEREDAERRAARGHPGAP